MADLKKFVPEQRSPTMAKSLMEGFPELSIYVKPQFSFEVIYLICSPVAPFHIHEQMRILLLLPILGVLCRAQAQYIECPHTCEQLDRYKGGPCWMEDRVYTFDTFDTWEQVKAARRSPFHPALLGDAEDRFGESEDWLYRNGSTPSAGTGPHGDHTTGSTQYFSIEGSHPHGIGEVWMDSPLILRDTHREGCAMTFWLHAKGLANR